ncbi:hypothetical protein OROGR_001088 [Orobanche gracilis]
MMPCLDLKIRTWVLAILVAFFAVPLACGFTDPRDVYAINQLYSNLGLSSLTGWILNGGDPCGPQSWQGVECVIANITAIKLSGLNLGGVLTEDLGSFVSIITLDLSSNHIGGSIPAFLPSTLMTFDLSSNQFGGRIPDSLSSLGLLEELSLKNNLLAGPIPDVFVSLTSLTSMDLSGNSLTSELPPSMGNLSYLTTLHLQNNQLTGVLDVLQDLPLTDLNIENNLFSGPIPPKILNIPNFRRDGNPFNTTVIPSPPATPLALPPSLTPSQAPLVQYVPQVPVHGPATIFIVPPPPHEYEKPGNDITRIAIVGLLVVALLVCGLCLFTFICCKKWRSSEKTAKGQETYRGTITSWRNSFIQEHKAASKQVQLAPSGGSQTKTAFLKHVKEHSIDMTGLGDIPRGPLPLPLLPAERIVLDPTLESVTVREDSSNIVESSEFFTIASLQQYTDSFSEENLIGKGTLGSVYRAQLPDGKVLAVKKLNPSASHHVSDREFIELVSRISKLHHANIVELVGYCLEHGQRLLVYNYCRNGTLDEALDFDYAINEKLSWNTRMRLALQAAKSLEYLHEVCKPPMVHGNFKSCNVLLEGDLSVRVSDCGLAPVLSTNFMAQLQDSGYGAPELDFGSYSHQSDVYSFGVLLLRLLTGQKSYDRSRRRGEQFIARWAISRLHDIDTLSRMVDPSLSGAYPSTMSLSRVADIISLCIQPEPEFRPPMSEIVQKLLRIIQTSA